MVTYNNYGLRNLPSVHCARVNVWNRHEAYAQGARDCFYRNVPPSLYSGNFIGFPGCGFPPIPFPPAYPAFGCCPVVTPFTGFITGNIIGQAVGSLVGLFRGLFSKS